VKKGSSWGRERLLGARAFSREEYNSKGNVTRATDAVGRTTTYNYAANEIDLLEIRQVNGQTTDLLETRTYNAQHQPLTMTDASGQTTTYTYNAAGQVQTVVTPPRAGLTLAQRTTTYSYDTNGYWQSVTGPEAGATITYTYDGYGRVRTITNSDGYSVTTDYDALGRSIKATFPDGTYEETVYNRLDPERRRDRLGRWTHTFYDALRRPVSMRDPLGRTTTQQWCTCGSLDKLIDANGNAITWDRDLQGRVTKETRADGSFKTFVYETTTGRLKSITDPKNQTVTYTHNLDNDLSQATYTNAVVATANVSYTYDPVYNRRTGVTDGTGTTNFTYYPTGVLGATLLKDVDGPLSSDTITYAYDELGRLKMRTLNGVTMTWTYDSLGRVTSQVNPLGTFGYTYNGTTNRFATLSYPNGHQTSYTYFGNTKDHRLQTLLNNIPATSTTVSRFDYDYDAAGNITWWKQQAGSSAAQQYVLGYDSADQITAATLKSTDPTPVVLKRYGYAYDAAANRTAAQIDDAVTGATFDNLNRLVSTQPGGALLFRGSVNEPSTVTVGGKPAQVPTDNTFQGTASVSSGTSNVVVAATDPSGNTRTNTYQVSQSGAAQTLTYDANGNLASDGTRTFQWDAENRLTGVLQGSTTLASFSYDATGRRFLKIAGGVTHTYVYDGAEIAEERLSTGGTIRYWHGLGIDQHLASQDQSGVASYFVGDHLGSITQATDGTGQVTLNRQYDTWGNLLAGGSAAGYAFTGREWDSETGLYYYRARYYDPKIGRFLSEDPLGPAGDINRYVFVTNNPLRYLDPFGLAKTGWPPRTPPCSPKFPPCNPGSCVLDLGYGNCVVITVYADCSHTQSGISPCHALGEFAPKTNCTENWWRSHKREEPPPNTLPPDPPTPPTPPGVSPPNCPGSGQQCPP
jgi:RHS repeat-associated protein